EALSVCGRSLSIHGRLAKTGVGPFDESYFVTFAGLGALVAAAAPPVTPPHHGRTGYEASARTTRAAHGDHVASPVAPGPSSPASSAPCVAGFAPGRVSAFLLQLTPGGKVEQVKFAIAQLPDVKVVEGNAVLTSSRQAVGTLFTGIFLFAALVLLALLILVSLLFSAIVEERAHEVGLLRAMGARPGQVMGMILAEAAMITGLGGLLGLAFGAGLLFLFARSLGYYFTSLGVPFAWPAPHVVAVTGLAALLGSALLGVAGALLPAGR